MTPKEEAEELLKEFDFRGTPFNDAGIFVSEMIYKNKKPNYGKKTEERRMEKIHRIQSV